MTVNLDPIPERQILSYTVRGAELEAVFRFLRARGPTTFEAVSDCFAHTEAAGHPRRDDLLRETIDFLRAVELVWRYDEDESDKLYRIVDGVEAEFPFQLMLLQQFHSMVDGRDAFQVIHGAIISANLFFVGKEDLLKRLEGTTPNSYAWNIEKLRTWESLASYAGLVRSTKPALGDVMCCPTPRLLLATMVVFQEHSKAEGDADARQQRLPASDWLDYVEERYFHCRTDRHRVHDGLASSLLSMEKNQVVRLSMGSDAPSTVALKRRSVSHIQVL